MFQCFLALRKIPSTGEVKAEQEKVQGHPELYKEFESLGLHVQGAHVSPVRFADSSWLGENLSLQ